MWGNILKRLFAEHFCLIKTNFKIKRRTVKADKNMVVFSKKKRKKKRYILVTLLPSHLALILDVRQLL